MNDTVPVLWHLKPSHYNEKARWALDYKGIPHRRVHPAPGLHPLIALRLTRRVATMPVIRLDGKAIGDSTRIIEALEQRYPEPPLYPADPEERRTALELEDYFDETLGPEVRRLAFNELMKARDFLREHSKEIAGNARQGKMFESRFFQALTRRRYGVSDEAAGEARMRIRAAMHKLEHLLDGGEHLVGGRFTVADLTAAAMLAPLIGPPGLAYRRPDVVPPPGFQQIESELRALPAGQWVIQTYERFRPPSAAINESAPPAGVAFQPADDSREHVHSS